MTSIWEKTMSLLKFRTKQTPASAPAHAGIEALLEGYSIEVMPRTAAKIEDFREHLPAGTRVYIAHIDGTEIDDMVATARTLREQGFEPMPHFPARSIAGTATLADWIARYQGEADVRQGLVLAAASRRQRVSSIRRWSFWKPGCSMMQALPICMSQATPKATVTSTPRAVTPR